MKGLCILAVVAAIIWAIKNAAGQRKAMAAAWADVCRSRGLVFQRGGTFAPPSMSGNVSGYLMSVDTVTRGSGKSNTTYTRYRVHYPKIGARIRLTRQVPLLSTIGMLFGGEDHETGDAQFDDKVVVRAPDERRALAYLTPERRRVIEKFLSAHKRAAITESNATFETVGLETRAAGLEKGISVLVELAQVLQPDRVDGPGSQFPGSVRTAATGVATVLGSAMLARTATDDAATVDDALQYDPEPIAVAEPELPAEPDPAPMADPVVDAPQVAKEPIAIGSSPDLPRTAPTPTADAPPETHAEAEPEPEPEMRNDAAASWQQEVCAKLFADDGGLSDARKVFEESYANLWVSWTGTIKSARHYYSDMVFGSAPGTRLEVAVARVASGILGDREVLAIVQLPEGADKELGARVGEEITFEGDLASVDPFMRQVFVRNAKLAD